MTNTLRMFCKKSFRVATAFCNPMIRNVSKKALQSPSHNAGPEWITVAQNFIRHEDSRIYYLRAKCKGKQLKRSLSTKDRKLADRRLREELLSIERDLSQNATLPKSTSLNDLIAAPKRSEMNLSHCLTTQKHAG